MKQTKKKKKHYHIQKKRERENAFMHTVLWNEWHFEYHIRIIIHSK
jgi:hypothetical protein